jgi:hypothetical protein
VQSIFRLISCGFSTGSARKVNVHAVSGVPLPRRCHNGRVSGRAIEVPVSCSICKIRKEKRFCLALHERICAQCCGEQREVTIDCPSECPYLQQARQHDKPREFVEGLPEELFPAVQINEDYLAGHEALLAGIVQTLGRISRSNRNLHDRDLIGALTNMAKSYQTLISSGLVYQETLPNPAQQAIIGVLNELLEEFREVETKHQGYTSLKDSDVLKALVFTLRLMHVHTSGRPLSREFIDFLHEQFPEASAPLDSAADAGSRIIMP